MKNNKKCLINKFMIIKIMIIIKLINFKMKEIIILYLKMKLKKIIIMILIVQKIRLVIDQNRKLLI